MIGAKVAVALAHPSRVAAPAQDGRDARERRRREEAQIRDRGGVDGGRVTRHGCAVGIGRVARRRRSIVATGCVARPQPIERLAQRARDLLGAGGFGRLGTRARVGVEGGDLRRDAREKGVVHLPALDDGAEQSLGRQALHLHRVLDGRTARADAIPVGRVHDRNDAAIDGRREPPVEPHLLVAKVPAALERREVEEREPHRLLHLVDGVTGEKDARDVRLHHFHLRRPLRIRARITQSGDERRVDRGRRSHSSHREFFSAM